VVAHCCTYSDGCFVSCCCRNLHRTFFTCAHSISSLSNNCHEPAYLHIAQGIGDSGSWQVIYDLPPPSSGWMCCGYSTVIVMLEPFGNMVQKSLSVHGTHDLAKHPIGPILLFEFNWVPVVSSVNNTKSPCTLDRHKQGNVILVFSSSGVASFVVSMSSSTCPNVGTMYPMSSPDENIFFSSIDRRSDRPTFIHVEDTCSLITGRC